MIEFVTACNNKEVFENNLRRSDILIGKKLHLLENYKNIPQAYNDFIFEANKYLRVESWPEDIVCYAHQDVFMAVSFESALQRAIQELPADWGVIGVCGVKLINGKKENFGKILDRGKSWAYNVDKLPAEVQTLDELLIITRGDFTFDENLPLDFYAADICMQAKKQGRKCYAINAYVEHNSTRLMGGRTESFFKSQEYFKQKWKEYLPVATTCAMITP